VPAYPPGSRRRTRWVALAASAVAVGLLLLLGGLFMVSMWAPVSRTESMNSDTTAPSPATSGTTASAAGSPSAASAAPSATPSPRRTSRPPASAKASPSPVDTGIAGYEATVLTLVNQQRAKAGCPALTRDSRLATAARAHSADMAAHGYFDHTTPSGVSAAQRITNAGYRWSSMGENIAEGQRTPADVMTAWMNSAGHRANILNCGYRNIGVGLAYDAHHTPFWTQDFAAPL
jgi:uncharacterized protein YkwD